jgi:hypothetical protein
VKVYYIVNWPWYEEGARMPRHPRWVKGKACFTGREYRQIARHRDGFLMWTAWDLCRSIAVLSPYRGLLLNDEATPTPMTFLDMADATEWPLRTFERGIPALLATVSWLGEHESDGDWAAVSKVLWGEVFAHPSVLVRPSTPNPNELPLFRASLAAAPQQSGCSAAAALLLKGEGIKGEGRERSGTTTPPSPPSASPETANNGTESAPEASGPKAGAGQRPQPPAPATPAAPSSAQPSATAPRSPSLIYPADATPTEILCAEATGWGVSPWEPVRSGVAQLLQLSNTCRTWTPQDFTHAGLPGVTDVDGYVSAFLRDKATPDTPPNNGKLKASFRHWHFQRIQQRTKALEPPKPPERPPDDGQRVSMTEMLGARLRWREKCRAAGVNPDAPDAEQKVPFEKLMAAVEVPNSGGAHGPARRSSEPR